MTDELSDDDLLNALREQPVLDALADELDRPTEEVSSALDALSGRVRPDPEASTEKLILQVDGAARNNPGPGGGGAVLKDGDGNIRRENSEFFGKAVTNNEAEYRALLLGLSMLPRDLSSLTLQMDSELAIKQLRGDYQVKSEGLRPYYERAKRGLDEIESVELEHIPREENEDADALANEAIDKHQQRESIG